MRRPPSEHGTRSCYTVNSCSRPECKAANARYLREWRAARLAAGWKLSHGRWTPPTPGDHDGR